MRLPGPVFADADIAAAARQVNADLLEQLQLQAAALRGGGEGGLAAAAAAPAGGLDSEGLLSAVRWAGWVGLRGGVGCDSCRCCLLPTLALACVHALCCFTPPSLPCSKQLEGEAEVSKLEALQWVHVLLSRDGRLLEQQRAALLLALCEALGAASGAPAALAAVKPMGRGRWRAGIWPRSRAVAHCSVLIAPALHPHPRPAPPCPADRVVTEALTVLASVAEQRQHFRAVMAALLDCFRGPAGARLLQVGGRGRRPARSRV